MSGTSKNRLILLGAVIAGLCFWARPIFDPDLGWHLFGGAYVANALGQLLDGSGSAQQIVPRQDLINTFNSNWHDYHWLGQLLLFLVFKYGGYLALQVGLGLTAAALAVILLQTIKDSQGLMPVALVLFTALYLIYDVSSVRPQVIAFLLIAIAQLVLLRRPKAELAILFLLSVILVNVHVYWIFIPFLWLAYRALPRLLGSKEFGAIYVWAGLLLLTLAGLVSPYGLFQRNLTLPAALSNYALIWDYLFFPVELKKLISEFKSPLSGIGIVPVLLLAQLCCYARRISGQTLKIKSSECVSALVGFILCLSGVKYVGVYAVISLPFIAYCLRQEIGDRFERLLMPALCLVITSASYFSYNNLPSKEKVAADIAFYQPQAACEELAKTPPTSTGQLGHLRVLTFFDFGGWCRWFSYLQNPGLDLRVTTDGRTQGLDQAQFLASFDLFAMREGWQQTLSTWNPGAIIAPRSQALSHILGSISEYKLLKAGENFSVFIKRSEP